MGWGWWGPSGSLGGKVLERREGRRRECGGRDWGGGAREEERKLRSLRGSEAAGRRWYDGGRRPAAELALFLSLSPPSASKRL